MGLQTAKKSMSMFFCKNAFSQKSVQNYEKNSKYARKIAAFRAFERKLSGNSYFFEEKSNLTPLQIVSITMLFHLGFKTLKPPLQLLDGLTLEAIGCLQLPNTLRYTALVPSKGFRTEVGLTFLRACPIFFVTSCFDAFRFGLAVQRIARTMRDKNEHHLPNRLQSYKMSVQLLWTDFGKMKKNIFFAPNSPFWSNFLSESGVIDPRNDLLREFFAPNVQIQLILAL